MLGEPALVSSRRVSSWLVSSRLVSRVSTVLVSSIPAARVLSDRVWSPAARVRVASLTVPLLGWPPLSIPGAYPPVVVVIASFVPVAPFAVVTPISDTMAASVSAPVAVVAPIAAVVAASAGALLGAAATAMMITRVTCGLGLECLCLAPLAPLPAFVEHLLSPNLKVSPSGKGPERIWTGGGPDKVHRGIDEVGGQGIPWVFHGIDIGIL